MKNIKKILVVLVAGVVLFAACQSKGKLNTQIAEAEKQVFESYNAEVMGHLVALYQNYAKAYPKDSLAVEYLLRATGINMRLGKGVEALANLDAVINKYPDNQKVAECYFLKGFVYEDVLHDIESAKNAYYEFVSLFPKHELALTASVAIAILESGKSDDELVASFNDETQIEVE